jgi:hypothetical protein
MDAAVRFQKLTAYCRSWSLLLPFIPGAIFLFSHCAIGRRMQAAEMAAKPLLARIKARMIRRM